MRTELLAPAGSPEALMAAVQAGTDAVYLGLGPFNARRNAKNFTPETLPDQVAYCHQRGTKVYLTLNTLVTDRELPQAAQTAAQAARAGVDAILVQDLGVARLLRETCPDVALHASTQMTVHDLDGVKACADLGMTRVVLSRELSASAIRTICQRSPVEVEVFAHGALCMCYSGQCWLSAVLGGRSGNRGLCAQPCRLPWRLDGAGGCLLSTRDLCGIGDLARLRDAGVASLKIEGRLKRAEYVAVTVAAYRRALDALNEGREIDLDAERDALKQMFNRGGFTRGYGPGVSERDLMYPDRPNHIGVRVGECRRDGEIVASASSFLSLDGEVELDVSTAEEYRGMGLATACAVAMLRDCAARGITVHWDAQNAASRRLAEKLGFAVDRVYPVYWVDAEEG